MQTSPKEFVSNIANFGPVEGSPLIPPSYLTLYFILFLALLCVSYIYFYRKEKPVLIWQKIKLLIVIAFILKATIIAGGGLVAAYWLIPSPSIGKTIPQENSESFSPTDRIEIIFDRPVSRAELEKSISPETPGRWVFENSLYTTHLYRKLVFYPTYSLRPNTAYTVKLSGIRNLLNISKPYEYQFDFTTQNSPKVVSVSPVSGQRGVESNTKINVMLDNPNNRISEFEFQFTPQVEYETSLDSSKTTYTLTPKTNLAPGTEYNLKIQKSDIILNLEDETIIERDVSSVQYDGNFTTKQTPGGLESIIESFFSNEPLKVTNFTPGNKLTAVNIASPIKVTFDRTTDRESAQQKFSISPKIDGTFSWDGRTLIFTPKNPLASTTLYTVTLARGIRALEGPSSTEDFKSEFSTQNATTKLPVPAYLQKYTLSCEIAALRMALNFRGANVSEDDLIPKVGLDPTPHNGNVWGNPNNAFVGNIRGTQMQDGYGVHWEPIAKAARSYRDAKAFENWNISELTREISKGNPVVIWVYSHFGTPTSWNTPNGTKIYAVRDEHAVVAVGFVGTIDNPTQIIINDPLSGQVYWSRSSFDKKWKIFGNSGVVIY